LISRDREVGCEEVEDKDDAKDDICDDDDEEANEEGGWLESPEVLPSLEAPLLWLLFSSSAKSFAEVDPWPELSDWLLSLLV
jgi:hypothetical protein